MTNKKREESLDWVLHDKFTSKKSAIAYGKQVYKSGLAKSVKVVKKDRKTRPYELYILPLLEREK